MTTSLQKAISPMAIIGKCNYFTCPDFKEN
jgi:hypothetical protein